MKIKILGGNITKNGQKSRRKLGALNGNHGLGLVIGLLARTSIGQEMTGTRIEAANGHAMPVGPLSPSRGREAARDCIGRAVVYMRQADTEQHSVQGMRNCIVSDLPTEREEQLLFFR